MFASSSSNPAVATTIAGGIVGTVSVFPLSGSSTVAGMTTLGDQLDFTALVSPGQPVARDSTIKSIRVFTSQTLSMNLSVGSVTPKVQVWAATGDSNVYTPLPGASVTLPALTGIVPIGTTGEANATNLSVPVTAGTRLLITYSITSTGTSTPSVVQASVATGIEMQ